jgi:ATP-binding cassette, subfamily B, bacterial
MPSIPPSGAQQTGKTTPSIWHIYSFFWPNIRKQWWLIVSSLAAMIVAVVAQLLEPWPLKWVLDNFRAQANGTSANPDILTNRILVLLAIGTVLISLFRAYADYFSNVGFFTVGNRVVIYVRDRVYSHLQQMGLNFHNRARSGDLIIRVTRDVSLLRDVTSTAVLPLIANVLVLLGMWGIMFYMQWQLTLIALATAPIFWLLTIRISRRIRETARKQRRREGAMATTASEALAGIAVVQALSLENKFAEDFASRNRKSQKEDLKASRLSVKLARSVDVLLAGAIAVVLYTGGKMVFSGSMSPGSLFLFIVYLKRSFKPAQQFAKYAARIAKAAAAGERIIDLLKQTPEIVDAPNARRVPKTSGQLSFDNVSFAYDPGHFVINNLTVDLPANKVTALVGASGSGKTTMLSLLLRLYDPSSGAIRLDGVDIREYKIKSLRQQMSVVLQDCLLFHGTILENISLGAEISWQETDAEHREEVRKQIEEAAKLAGAHDFILRLPNGYETAVGEGGVTLSRGQRQRISIARAAMRRSPILLLDEPTTGLDEKTERAVMAALLRLAQERTTLLVTHNLSLAAQADEIIYLEHGQIVARGTHRELLQASGEYAAHYLLQHNQSTSPTHSEVRGVPAK